MREHAPLPTASLSDTVSAVGDSRRHEPLRLEGTKLLGRYVLGRLLGSGGSDKPHRPPA